MLTCRNQNGDSPLMWACTRGHTECIRYIIDFAPKETQHKNDAGINALMCTTMSGHEEALSLLLEKGRDAIDHTDRNGNTVLHLAIIARQAPCVKVILAHNPNLHVNNHKALSPLDLIAQEECCEECKKVVDNHLFVLQQRSAMATTSLLSELSVNTDPPATSKRDDQSTVPDAVAPSASSGDVAVACAEVEKQNDSVLQFESDQSSDLCQFRMAKMEDQLKECVGESVAERLELLPEHLLGMGLDGLSASQLDMVAKIHREVGEKIEQSRHHIEHQMVVDMHIEMLELHAKLNKLSRNS
uniref:Uncharacterized protein n=1 Tax=Spongospora subterranea TaxID=70186 RepID=A0A0H5RMT9_9EUKA|eukprot:CRZ10044.1 hypothetical protein [Spongospora subterranea]